MSFTAEDVVFTARDRAPEFRDPEQGVDRDVLARAFNEAILEMVLQVVRFDPERLETEYEIPNSVVTADPDDIDLTDDGVGGAGTREWLRIDYFDFESDDERDECIVGTIEARHRLKDTYQHDGRPIGFVHDRLTKLRKIDGWDTVDSLWVYGVLLPIRATAQTLGGDNAVTYASPRLIEDAAKFRVLVYLADYVGITDRRKQEWAAKLQNAKDDLIEDAKNHLTQGARIEDVPWAGSEV